MSSACSPRDSATRRGRRAALIHRDGVNHRIRGRRGSRLLALTSGGAIPDNGEYRVLLEPSETFRERSTRIWWSRALRGTSFNLGNASWKILRINSGTGSGRGMPMGQPPGVPFWLGEAPGRTGGGFPGGFTSPGRGRGRLWPSRADTAGSAALAWALTVGSPTNPLSRRGRGRQLAAYFAVRSGGILGVIPSEETLVLERFFDESGGMQLVLHSPFGSRVNRAWGLALRKRFCRSFNFELQAAATDDAIVLSLGTQHSFPLDEVFIT